MEDLKHFMSGASKHGRGRGSGRHTPDYPEIKMGDLSPNEESLKRVQEPRLQVCHCFLITYTEILKLTKLLINDQSFYHSKFKSGNLKPDMEI